MKPVDYTEWYDLHVMPKIVNVLSGPAKLEHGYLAKVEALPGCRIRIRAPYGDAWEESILYCEFKEVDQKTKDITHRAGTHKCSKG